MGAEGGCVEEGCRLGVEETRDAKERGCEVLCGGKVAAGAGCGLEKRRKEEGVDGVAKLAWEEEKWKGFRGGGGGFVACN